MSVQHGWIDEKKKCNECGEVIKKKGVKKMSTEGKRHDKCKCGRVIYWDTDENEVICRKCDTRYKVDCNSILVYWLVEKIDTPKPYTTEAR